MKFQSNRIITSDIRRSVAFYEKALAVDAHWFTADFAELSINAFTLAIGSTQTLQLFGDDLPIHSDKSAIIMEFRVGDVDEEYLRIKDITEKIIQKPTTMPWGNRSLIFCDPDGNLLNFFTPVSPAAIQKFS